MLLYTLDFINPNITGSKIKEATEIMGHPYRGLLDSS